VAAALRRHASGASEILDVGCGLGEMTEHLARRLPGARFTGVDFSAGAIESCRGRAPQHHWVVADVVHDELPGPVDAAVCSELLEHLDDPAPAMARIAGALRPGGTVVVTVPHGTVFATEQAIGHVRHPTLEMLREWFDASGLDVVEVRRWGWPGYTALKYAVNIDAERALASFGSGRYSWLVKRANDVAYFAVGLGSFPNNRRGPQTIIVGRRRTNTV
jgi:SAM-dependent methyltransferase